MPKYYEISEAAAKRAKDMNSYSDYAPGSAMAGYRAMVDEAYALAEKQKAQVDPMYHDKIDALVDRYSLDCDDGIEYSACLHEPTPQELLDRMELFVHLWNAINSLPEVQGVRVEAHLILGKSYRQIAREQGVDKSAVRHSVKSGKAAMRKYLKKFL